MGNRYIIHDGNAGMDADERAVLFTKNALESLRTDTSNAADYLTEKIAVFEELNTSLQIFDRITDIFYGFKLNGADENLLRMCENRLRHRLKYPRAGNSSIK